MTLQEQVCTLEQSKKLKELGCEQESLYYWSFAPDNTYSTLRILSPRFDISDANVHAASAYTVAELGEMMGVQLAQMYFDMPHIICVGNMDNLSITWRHRKLPTPFSTEAQARAALLIHILEQKEEKHEH